MLRMSPPPFDDDEAWQPWRIQWRLREGTTYLNHGSFGPPPEPVRAARREWIERLDSQPMDFFVRTLEPALFAARERLARFVRTAPENLVFVENATTAMNIVADNFPLAAGDEVVLTDHEYDAVRRIWQRKCRRAGASEPVIAKLPLPIESNEQIVEAVFAAVSPRTRLIVVSHVASATALILPVAEICRRARQAGLAVCIDGPHAPAHVPLDIDALGCDFYTASLHKWLSAPFGSGFVYVAPQRQSQIEPLVLSWGRVGPQKPQSWDDEFVWSGTRDPSAYLSVPAAIDFIESAGVDALRERTHYLARFAYETLRPLSSEPPIMVGDHRVGSMVLIPLPPGDSRSLQTALWKQHGIEVPIIDFADRRFVRVSCHLYNRRDDIQRLYGALTDLL